MTSAFQRNERRHCSRCGKGLEDPASEERGVGPVCALKDTALYSRTIAANYAGATSILLTFSGDESGTWRGLPQNILERFKNMMTKVLRQGERATLARWDGTEINLPGQDLRSVIKDLDWMLSHKMEERPRKLLIQVVKFLGYVELAAVLSQEASTTPARLWFKDGVIYLKGKSCKAGFVGMRGIDGITIPRRGSEMPYTCPAYQAEKFLSVVQDFWPMYEIKGEDGTTTLQGATLETMKQTAQEWLQAHRAPVPQTPSLPVTYGPLATVKGPRGPVSHLVGETFELSFPWLFEKTKEMYVLVGHLKTISKLERYFDGEKKVWIFLSKHKDFVLSKVTALFTIREEG